MFGTTFAVLAALAGTSLAAPAVAPVADPVAVVVAAPVADEAAAAVATPTARDADAIAAVVAGLPTCATTTMSEMLARATDFGCGSETNADLDIACLCRSKPFKSDAKQGIHAACSGDEDRALVREWAVTKCTGALNEFTQHTIGVSRFPTSDVDSDAPRQTKAPSEAVFDIDDDEDFTAGAPRPTISVLFAIAFGVFGVLAVLF